MRRFLLYGLGTGRGHATRMGALAVALRGSGAIVKLCVSSAAEGVALQMGVSEHELVACSGAEHRAWESAFERFQPTDCVVDTFAEGLYQELSPDRGSRARWVALLRCRRDVTSEVFLRALDRYALVLDLEPTLEWAPRSAIPFGVVTRLLGPKRVQPVQQDVLLVASQARHHAFLDRLRLRLERAGIAVAWYPPPGVPASAAALLSGKALSATVVVGPAGYNLTYELSALSVWHVALPVPRRYDVQERRAERIATVAGSPEAVERRIRSWLDRQELRHPVPVRSLTELASALLA